MRVYLTASLIETTEEPRAQLILFVFTDFDFISFIINDNLGCYDMMLEFISPQSIKNE
jgi:hypothetical protein